MAQPLTLTQFERIDGLFNACLRRVPIENLTNECASPDYLRAVYFRPEWELFDACVEVVGYEAASDFPGAVDCAADILTRALTSSTLVMDREAA